MGRRIKAARETQRLSQKDLADALGVRQQSVSKWERGASKPESLAMLRRLEDLIGVPGELLVLAGYEATVLPAGQRPPALDYNSRIANMPDRIRRIIDDIIDAEESRHRDEH
jgi:transcriptional regulator with XRE-family HTH domain